MADISETSYRVSIALDIPGQEPEDEEDRREYCDYPSV